MSTLIWSLPGERFYEAGVDRGVLYPLLIPGVAWNGLISVDESVEGGEATSLYFDGNKTYDFVASESFQATLEALSAPTEFAACDGSAMLSPGLYATQQPRQSFGLSYRTKIGNDIDGTDHGYKLHLVYGATAMPASRSNQTISARVDPTSRQWSIKTVPPAATTYKPTSHLVIDSTKTDEGILSAVEEILYGVDGGADPRLPTQAEVMAIFSP